MASLIEELISLSRKLPVADPVRFLGLPASTVFRLPSVPATVAKSGKINEFSGRILEIEGLPNLKVEQAFELSDASAERSAAGCTIKLNKEPIIEYLKSNVVLMKNMIADGYADARTLARRIEKVEAWLAKPELLEADKDAEYAHVIEIDMNEIKEPILCCPNDPDDAKFLSEVAGTKIDEAFIGSCMTNIGHFRAAAKLLGGQRDIPVKLWVAPPTKMDESELIKQGHYAAFGTAGAGGCTHRNARLLAVHGQPSPGARRRDRGVHQHPQLPQPLGQKYQRVFGQCRVGSHCLQVGPYPHRGRVPRSHGHREQRRRGHLQVLELQPE